MPAELQKVADMVTANTIFTTKEVLTSDEAAAYMGISKSYLYKLTMRQHTYSGPRSATKSSLKKAKMMLVYLLKNR